MKESNKVKLISERKPNLYGRPFGGNGEKVISHSLPFYKSDRGEYYHRVRAANSHWRNNSKKLSHISISFWCGNSGSISGHGKLYAEIPVDGVLCATCEGRAIGAGQDGAQIINGRNVMYSPRLSGEV